MRSRAYWERRKLERMDEYHKDSDRIIGKVLEAYQSAIDDINSDMDKIFDTYSRKGSFAEDKDIKYLNQRIPNFLLSTMKKIYPRIKNEKARKWILAKINAPAYRARITRLEALKESLYLRSKQIADVEIRMSTYGYTSIINSAYYKTIFDIQKNTGIGFSFAEIPHRQVEEILKNNWSGKHYSERIWNNTDKLASELEYSLTKGFMTGASVQKMSKDIADKMQVGEYAATRLIRTETTYVANMAELEAYKESGVEKIMYLATLDLRTSDICREHDKKIISVDKAVPGENIPPLHANCRSTTIEIFEDDNLEELQRRSRDPVTGKNKTVPADMNYQQWYDENVANNPRAIAEEKKIKNKAADKKQYERYKEILGNETPKSFDKFQELKYNNIGEWNSKNREYATIKKIRLKETYSETYRQKLIDIYYDFKVEGYEFTDHSLNRFLGQKSGKGKKEFSKEDLLKVMGSEVNYLEGIDRTVKHYDGISVIQNKETKEVVSIIVRENPKKGWESIDK